MIVVKVEIWPQGDESNKRQIAEGRIWNTDGDDAPLHVGNYRAEFQDGHRRSFDRGEVKDYPRLRYDIWDLVLRLLKAAMEGRYV